MIRTVVVGASHWHVPLYVQAWRDTHEVVAVSDPSAEAAGRVAAALGCHPYQDLHRMLDTVGPIDLAYVFGPHAEMAAVAHRLIELRTAFVIEKPAAVGMAELTRLARAARTAGVPVAVPLVQRVGPVIRALAGTGRPTHVAASFVAGPPERYLNNGSPWMLEPRLAGGGSLTNLGVHFVDMARELTGLRVRRVVGAVHNSVHHTAVDDHAIVIVEGERGESAQIEVGYLFPDARAKRHTAFTAAGAGGYVAIDSSGLVTTTTTDGTVLTETIDLDSDPLYDAFVRRVAAAYADGMSGLPGLDDLLGSMAVINAAYADAASRTPEGMRTWAS